MSHTEGSFNSYSTIDVENIDKFIKQRQQQLLLEKQKTKGKKSRITKGILAPDKKTTKAK